MPKIAYGYARGSTDPQVLTLEQQEHHAREYFSRVLEPRGYVWGGMFIERGVSGSKPFRERPVGHALAIRLRDGDAVVFAKLDRGFRSCADGALVIEDWNRQGVGVHLLDLNVDTTTPMGLCFVQMAAAFAQLDRAQISERTKMALAELRRQGRPTGGRRPWGLKHGWAKGKMHQIWVPDEKERALMREIAQMKEERRLSNDDIRDRLRKMAPLGRKGKRWTAAMVNNAYRAYLELVRKGEMKPYGKEEDEEKGAA